MKRALLFFAIFLVSALCFAQSPAVDNDHLVQPAQLAQLLQSKDPKPLIFNVGPRMLYEQAHITGAELIGPASDPHGLEALRTRVKSVPKKQEIVLYCGCCPWSHCPNVEPAYQQLKSLGFTSVKVLYIVNNIGTDWVYKGYPTVKGQ
jgi:thiosulfate/3-mercaptopyruvate sulfurtransferase